jgi:flagellar biosynthesis protein FliR
MPDFLTTILAPRNWPTFVFISARLGGLMLVAPLWSMTALTRTARAAIVVMLTLFLMPLSPRALVPAETIQLPLPLLMEMLIGLGIGLTAAVIVQGVGLAGEVVSLQMGLHLAPALSLMMEEQPSGVGQLQSLLAMMIYLSVGGHLLMIQGIAHSLQVLPPGGAMEVDSGAKTATAMMGVFYQTAIRTAAPVMVALLLTNVAMAILNRAVPQLNTMMVALPLSIGVGLLMVGASLPFVSASIGRMMQSLPASVESVLQGFRLAAGSP